MTDEMEGTIGALHRSSLPAYNNIAEKGWRMVVVVVLVSAPGASHFALTKRCHMDFAPVGVEGA